jgi:hypothetical protein
MLFVKDDEHNPNNHGGTDHSNTGIDLLAQDVSGHGQFNEGRFGYVSRDSPDHGAAFVAATMIPQHSGSP